MKDNYNYLKHYQKIIVGMSIILLSVIILANPLTAKPWWWVQFASGRQTFGGNSDGIQDIEAYWCSYANDADTIIMSNYAWYSTEYGGHMICGTDGDTSADDNGLVAVSNSAGRIGAGDTVIVIYDSDYSFSNKELMLADIKGGNITAVGYSDTFIDACHNKVIYIANKGFMTASGNFSNSQRHLSGAQPNNYLWIFYDKCPDAVNAFGRLMEDFAFQWKNPARSSFLYHPTDFSNSDTIEIYFSTDDNDSITSHAEFQPNFDPDLSTNGDYDIEDVLIDKTNRATESIFYAFNRFSLTADNGTNNPNGSLRQAMVDNDTVSVIAGTTDSTNDGVSGNYAALIADHTCRDANNWPDGAGAIMHNKFIIFDMEIVATGSANQTGSSMRDDAAGYVNAENEVIIHDFRIARKFMQHWHYIMQHCPPNGGAGGDNYDNTPPDAPDTLTVTPYTDHFSLTWEAPTSGMSDFSRYYIFLSTSAINSNYDIGDWIDNDADSWVDEDPVGDVDRFNGNDDDADGSIDEDPWMYPEAQVRGGDTTVDLYTWNVGENLLTAQNYWFAVVAVDTWGNESVADTAGPYQLGGNPQLTITLTNVGDTGVVQGDTPVIALRVNIDSDSDADNLTSFGIANTGSADSGDLSQVALYQDVDNNGLLSSSDTFLGYLNYNTGNSRWENTSISDSIANTGGDTYIVVIEISGTATIGDTVKFQIPSLAVEATFADSGPSSALTNSGQVTIQSANQINVTSRGEYPDSSSVQKGDTIKVMTLQVTVSQANDTLTAFSITNLGSMTSSDIDNITIYDDAGSDSQITSADTVIGFLPYINGSTWYDTNIYYYFTGTTLDLIAAVKVSASATGGRSFKGEIPAYTLDTTKGDSGPTSNLTSTAIFSIVSDTAPDTAVVINEFAPNPAGTDQDNEYVEIYNKGPGIVNIKGWDVRDTSGDIMRVTSDSDVLLYEGWLAVFQVDSTNSPDSGVGIYDTQGIFQDTYPYSVYTWNQTFGSFSNSSADGCKLYNSAATLIDEKYYINDVSGQPLYRKVDGWDTWHDPDGGPATTTSIGSPNGDIVVTLSTDTVSSGESFTITVVIRDNEGATVTDFNVLVNFSASTGIITPSVSGALSSGNGADSANISGVTATDSSIVKVYYNASTFGTSVLTVNYYPTYNVSGTIPLEGTVNNVYYGCTVYVTNGTDTYYADTVTNDSGEFTISNVQDGNYTLYAKEYHHIGYETSGIIMSGSNVDLGIFPTLIAGDANDDNKINIFDASRVKISVDSNGSVFKEEGDINKDGMNDDKDLNYIRKNFRKKF